MKGLRACTAMLLVAACAGAVAPERVSLTLRAQSTHAEPIAGTRFWADGRELGVTHANGTLQVALQARAGQAVILTAACPPAFHTREPRRRIVPQYTAAPNALELTTTCEPLDYVAVVIVRARAGTPLAGLPIRSEGQVVGQTDADGTAHILLHARSGASLHVALDTGARPELEPRDPVQTFALGDEDAILLVDQRFDVRKPKPRGVQRHPRALAKRTPYRID